jgi:hypothetical protein
MALKRFSLPSTGCPFTSRDIHGRGDSLRFFDSKFDERYRGSSTWRGKDRDRKSVGEALSASVLNLGKADQDEDGRNLRQQPAAVPGVAVILPHASAADADRLGLLTTRFSLPPGLSLTSGT